MKSLVVKIILALLIVGLIGTGVGFAAYTFLNLDLPKIEKLQDYKPNMASQIISKDGVILAEIGKEKREVVDIKQVPKRVIDAFLSAEDDKFFEHKGVDYFGLVRAMFANFKAGRVVQGGSTITQQVAKSLLLTSERSITRKVKDFILAQRIEEKLNKNEILHLYLNQVYLGNGYYGVKAAARGYYKKDLKDVTVAEAAMLAGLLVAPGKYSPYVNPVPAKKRQNYVLERMHKLKKISDDEYAAALKEKTVFHLGSDELKAGYFTEWVRQKVVDVVGEDEFLTNGFKIKTSLDWSLQKVAEEQLIRGVKEIDKRQGYKGPYGHVEDISNFEIEYRRKLYKNKSHYFVIDENTEKHYEYYMDEKLFGTIQDENKKIAASSGDGNFITGVNDKDELPRILQTGEQYEAAVIKVDDTLRLVYITLAGTPGVIPFDHLKWAHKRSVNENTGYYQEVTKPSSILKEGDLIYVQLVKGPISISGYLNKEGSAALAKNRNAALIKSQKYLICMLDQVPEVQGALFSIDARTGEVISYVGGNDFSKNKFNRVIQAKRQPGSSFKPLLFAAALENGYNPSTIIMDTPEAMPGFDSASSWKPKNYDGEYKGPVTMRVALEQSRNIPTIKIADKVGVSNILKFIERIGFNAKLEPNLSIALGTFGVSPRDLVSTFAIFPNGGKFIAPKAILSVVDRDGKKYNIPEYDKDQKIISDKEDGDAATSGAGNVFTRNLNGTQVYDPRLAFIMTNMMKGVVTSGTATSARDLSSNIAGKTGTTNDYVDAWFVGFTSNVVTGVWTGFDDNKTLGFGETGGRSSLPIWKEYMRANIRKFGDQPFEVPPGITSQWIEKQTGRKVTPNAAGSILEYFAESVDLGPISSGTPGAEPTTSAPKARSSSGDDEYYENQ